MTPLTVLYTNIGRGHPFYLDGIVAEWQRLGGDPGALAPADVFGASGFIPRQLWRLMRALYRRGSSPGLAAPVYRRLRARGDFSRPGFALKLAGRSLRARFGGADQALLVAHPLLVAILQGGPRLYYQHGEMATPAQAVVPGADCVFVPTAVAGEPFVAAGYERSRVIVTGLCIEPDLVARAQACYDQRLSRYARGGPLVGAFFSSGAEPRLHVERLVAAASSAVRAGGSAIVFAEAGRRFAADLRRTTRRAGTGDKVALVEFASRGELDRAVARHFERFDYFVAPPHERTHWALGLGLPMFAVGPDVGPFAPLNRAKLEAAGVALGLDSGQDAETFGTRLERLSQEGALAAMAAAGFGRHPIDGFRRIAEYLMK